MMNNPPIIVRGTTETIPPLIADKYVLSLRAVSAGTIRRLSNAVARSINQRGQAAVKVCGFKEIRVLMRDESTHPRRCVQADRIE
jgi:hypothetical protein